MHRILKIVWTLAALCVLVAGLNVFDGAPDSDAALLIGYGMSVLAFPSSLLLPIVFVPFGRLLFETTGYVFTVTPVSLVVQWLSLFAIGYWQWFILLPRLSQWWRSR